MKKLKPKYTLEKQTSKFLEKVKLNKIKKYNLSALKIDDLKKLSPKVINLIIADTHKFNNKQITKKKEINIQIIKEYIEKLEKPDRKSLDLNTETKILINLLATKDATIIDAINILNYFNKFKTNTEKYKFIHLLLNHPEYNVNEILKQIKIRGDYLETVNKMYKIK